MHVADEPMNREMNTAENPSAEMAIKMFDVLNEGLSLMATKPKTDQLMATITAYAMHRLAPYCKLHTEDPAYSDHIE